MQDVLVLVLGGARSGKSAAAEALADRTGRAVTYVATGEASDDDMRARIAAHRARRPPAWTTVEAGADLAAVVASARGTLLVDALGTWLARHVDFEADVEGLCCALGSRTDPTIVVSDEVGLGVHPSTDVGRRFRDALGAANRAVADRADRVLLVVAGRVLDLPRPADPLPW
jgi:adenosyl cobinamide kinase/adenosyl cobinamide phosphate guanylyltransferase